jgi:multidrug resistance efflux pump
MALADFAGDEAAPKTGKLRLRRVVPAAGAAILILGYLGYRWYASRQPYEWSGTVEARTISVGSRAGGRIKEILVHEGDRLEPEQPLLVLEPGDWMAQKLAAEGQLRQAKANLDKLVHGARPEEIDEALARYKTAAAALAQAKAGSRREQIAAAEARLNAAQATADKASLDVTRAQALFAKGAATQEEVDNTNSQLKSAVAQRDAQKEQLDELKNGTRREELEQAQGKAREAAANATLVKSGSRIEDIQAAQGQVDAAQGKLDQILTMIDELTIRAPRAARVETLDLRPGDILAPNAVAAKLVEDDQLYVRIYVPETLIGHIHVGQEVPIFVDSFPKKAFQGVVERINNLGEYSPRNLQTADERADQVFGTRIGIRTGRDQLRAGMAAFIRVPRS